MPVSLAALALAACGEPGVAQLALPGHDEALFDRGLTAVITGWEAEPQLLASRRCGACHPEAHAGWAAGMHARAWTSPRFQRAYRGEPHRWCLGCHAPLAAQASDPALRAEGIGCAACHVRDGTILGPRAWSGGAHPVVASTAFEGAALCAGCHQFAFPVSLDPLVGGDAVMQDTVGEWRAARADACASCHYDGHRLRGPHDVAWMAALVLDAEVTTEPGLLSFSLLLDERGHSAPTGDLFRSITFELARDRGFEEPYFEKRFGRSFAAGLVSQTQLSDRVELPSTAIPAWQPRISITVDAPPWGPVYARLRYNFHDPRVADGRGARDPDGVTLWSTTVTNVPSREDRP